MFLVNTHIYKTHESIRERRTHLLLARAINLDLRMTSIIQYLEGEYTATYEDTDNTPSYGCGALGLRCGIGVWSI